MRISAVGLVRHVSSHTSRNDIPESLDTKLSNFAGTLDTKGTPFSRPSWICCGFGPQNSYLLAFKQGNSFTIFHDDLPPKLEAWLFDPISGAHLRDVGSLQVTLGEYDSFFAMDKNGFRWDGLPPGLEEWIQAGFRPAGAEGLAEMPRLVALGKDREFVLVTSNGTLRTECSSQLRASLLELSGSVATITFMAINAYSEESEFFLTLKTRETPMYHVTETKRELAAGTKELADVLTESFRREKSFAEALAAAKAAQSVNNQLSLTSLNIQASPNTQYPRDTRSTAGMDYLLSPQNIQASPNTQYPRDTQSTAGMDYLLSPQNIQASPNTQYPRDTQSTAGMDYLLSPQTMYSQGFNGQTLSSARSFNDLRSANNAMQMRQRNQQFHMANRADVGQAQLAAQLRINESQRRGSEAILDAIW
ncbi:hypothetical protein G7Y89_g13024 [Cudoniella acicularis]|uniref:Uncharacterized protein n=1 Tax=Cudoniella acicularis TaxID=354080 RepID=A0A8H4R909_9HELO|nr:hypothetical protein G7Y89_g13024 [Cudoniella acicularis]